MEASVNFAQPDSAEAFRVATPERLRELSQIFEKYKSGKANLDKRIVEAEQWWKLRHWAQIRAAGSGDPEPSSAWLVNTILSKHSAAVDAYPEPVCLAREAGDVPEAEALSSILPVVLQQNEFDQTWSDVWWYKLKSGTGVYGVFWDPDKLGGLGDISIKKVDILNLFWEPGANDIQDSQYLFSVRVVDNKVLEGQYPQLSGTLGATPTPTVRRYYYDDTVPTDGKSLLIDCYYRVGGRLHLIKYVNDTVLVSTEDDPEYAGSGLYNHGKYPFVFDPLFPEEGYPGCGYGYVDLCKEPQKVIDILNNCMVQSSVSAATPRWFIRRDGGVNEDEYADLTKKFVHVMGRIDDESVRQIITQPMPANTVEYLQMKVDEMKETSGNRDVNNGGTAASVTAASAIAALQEAGNGLSRDMIASSYRAFRRVVELCIELIRQFYDQPRQFRITGGMGVNQYISYTNAGIQPQQQGAAFGQDMGVRVPVIDIEVEVRAETTYTKQAYNQLAIQLYQLGVFSPENATMATMMLGMMDFNGKNELLRQIQTNGNLAQQLAQWQQMAVAAMGQIDPQRAQALAQAASATQAGTPPLATAAALTGDDRVQRARQNARDGAMPR